MRSTTKIFFVACILLSVCHGIPQLSSRFKLYGPRKVNKRNKPWTKQPSGIIGGDVAVRGQFSYVVSIQHASQNICGGSFIDFQFVVTAAHCVVDHQNGKFFEEQPEIFANVVHLKENNVNATKIKVKQVYVLKAYNPESLSDHSDERVKADIAVLKLEKPVNVIKYDSVTKLSLPEESNSIEYTDKLATIVGFGWDQIMTIPDPDIDYIYEVGTSTGQLRFAQARIISNEVCNDIMYSIYESHICAKVKQRKEHQEGEGVCAGDSGGPLVYNNILIGVLNTSPVGCVESEGLGVYTRVSSYLDFIKAAMHDEITEDMRTKFFGNE